MSVLTYISDSTSDRRQSVIVHLSATQTLVSGTAPNIDLQATTADDSFAIDVVREALKAACYMYVDPGVADERLVP